MLERISKHEWLPTTKTKYKKVEELIKNIEKKKHPKNIHYVHMYVCKFIRAFHKCHTQKF